MTTDMRTVNVTDVNVPREAYTAPQVEVIEMEAENIIATSPGALDNGDPGVDTGAAQAPRRSLWD